MLKDLSALTTKEYPGRLIILGRDLSNTNAVIVYAITGRSVSSQSRKMEASTDGVWVKPTDEKTFKEGNRELLIYPAILFGHGIAVSNGAQTIDIKEKLSFSKNPTDVLSSALMDWEYEPDFPTYTPRISGCVLFEGKAALGIIKRALDGSSSRLYFKVPMLAGQGKMISTYSGTNKDPLPSFNGFPEDVLLNDETADKTADTVYSALAPQKSRRDLRVSVVCIFSEVQKITNCKISVLNRSEIIQNE